MNQALEVAIYSKLTGDTTLMNLIDEVYNGIAPDNADRPFLVMQTISGVDSYTFELRMNTRLRYQFTAIDEGLSKATLWNAINRVDVLLNDASLTVADYDVKYIRRDRINSYAEMSGARFQRTGLNYQYVYADYIIDIEAE
jgi:hypothetical protein